MTTKQTVGRSLKKTLTRLAEIAYERELSTQLRNLESEFRKWNMGSIDSFSLSDEIHRFHDGPSRKLFVKYDIRNARDNVAQAIALGILSDDEVSNQVREELAALIKVYATGL